MAEQEQKAVDFLKRMERGHDKFWVRFVLIEHGLPEDDDTIDRISTEATK